MINSKQKGNRFERWVASFFRDHGYNCRRGQQYSGANGDADVVGAPGIHIECKAVERLNLYDAMAQAVRDGKELIPVVIHKKNHHKVLVTMHADDWIELYKQWEMRNE